MSSKKIFLFSQYKLQNGVRVSRKRVILEILRSTLGTLILVVGSRAIIYFFQDRWDWSSLLILTYLSPIVIVPLSAHYSYIAFKWNRKLQDREIEQEKVIRGHYNSNEHDTIKYYQLGKNARIGTLVSLVAAVLMSCMFLYICITNLIKHQIDNRTLVLIVITIYIVPLTTYRIITAPDICLRKIYFSNNKMYFMRDDKILKVFDPMDIQKKSIKNNKMSFVDKDNKRYLIYLEEDEFDKFLIDFNKLIGDS